MLILGNYAMLIAQSVTQMVFVVAFYRNSRALNDPTLAGEEGHTLSANLTFKRVFEEIEKTRSRSYYLHTWGG